MCVILGRDTSLSKTVVYAAEAFKQGPDGSKVVHILGYQNQVETNGKNSPNAMILPIPAVSLGPDNVLDAKTHGLSKLLNTYQMLMQPKGARSRSFTKGFGATLGLDHQVFESGAYTIALASTAAGLRQAVRLVPTRKRPDFSDEMLTALAEAYPGWPIAICCFNDADFASTAPDPLFWWYEPKDPTKLFAPALDAHDGAPPKKQQVERDHTVVFGSYQAEGTARSHSTESYFRDVPVAQRWMVMYNFWGQAVWDPTENGDFVASLPPSTVHHAAGRCNTFRVEPPPGWAASV